MAVSKVILNGTTLMDVTQDTVAANKLLSGETAHKNDGTEVTGNIATKSSSDLTASGATVTAPAGYYSSAASKSVASGTAGTPTATKSAVSNHAVTVTPSVTNTTGYISGGTKTGTAVSVSASELVSGSQTITENGTVDVTNLAEVIVDIDTSPKYTATISGTGHGSYTFVEYDNVSYYTDGESFEFAEGDTIRIRAGGMRAGGSVVIDGVTVVQDHYNAVSYYYTAPASDIAISLSYSSEGSATVETQGSGSITVEPLSVTINGTYTAPSGKAYSPVTVNVPTSGGTGGNMSDPIRFFDYDGTLVASYTSVPSALPSVPTHSGLKDGTWNYTLAQVTTQFNAMGTCDVGANYMTQSEDTEIDVVMQEGRLSPILTIAVNGTVTVDWGDNTSADTATGTSLTTRQDVPHTYASAGSYTIKIHVVSGSFTFYGSSSHFVLRKNTTGNENRVYANCIQAVRLGKNITSLGSYAFYYCYSLASISIPSGITSIGSSAFSNCYSLASISIPSGITSIGSSAFSSCSSLASISIPSGITSIGNSAFNYCYGMAEYHVLPTTPPTLGTTPFNNIVSDCKIYVPSASLSDYQTAWSTYASYLVGE